MKRENPLHERLHADPCYTALVRAIGYGGCLYRELWDKLQDLVQQYGQQRVESATVNLLHYDGQFTGKPPPLVLVQLRSNVRPLCWGILGAPPEHPWHELLKRPEPLPPPWEMEPDGTPKKREQPPASRSDESPKKRAKKKAS